MRRWLLLFALLVSGCGQDPASRLYGVWRVDPTSVKAARQGVDVPAKQEWKDAGRALAEIEVRFFREPREVTASGLGLRSTARWSLVSGVVRVESNEAWPEMRLDPDKDRIRLRIERQGDVLSLDLVR